MDPDTGRRVTASRNDRPLEVEDLGVVGHGSEIFVRDDVDDIVEFVNSRHEPDDG